MRLSLYRSEIHSSTGEPRTLQVWQRGAANEECADTRWMPEHLVEGDRHEIGLNGCEIQARCGHKGGGIEQHAPSFPLRPCHEFERMFHAGKIGLRRKRKKISA